MHANGAPNTTTVGCNAPNVGPNSRMSVPNSPNVGPTNIEVVPSNIDVEPSNINVAPGSSNVALGSTNVAPNGLNVAPNNSGAQRNPNPIIQWFEDSDKKEEADAPPHVPMRTKTRPRGRSSVRRIPMYYPPAYLNVDNDSEDEEVRMDVMVSRHAGAHRLILEEDMKSVLWVSDAEMSVLPHELCLTLKMCPNRNNGGRSLLRSTSPIRKWCIALTRAITTCTMS